MPKINDDKELDLKRIIRDTISLDPLISTRRLQDVLHRNGFSTANGNPLDREYIGKLIRKLRKEASSNVDRQVIAERLAGTKERFRVMTDRLLKIAFWDYTKMQDGMFPPTYQEQIRAIDTVMKWDIAILNAEMDAGIFQRNLGKLEIEKRNRPVDDDQARIILSAMQQWGFVDAEVVPPERPAPTPKQPVKPKTNIEIKLLPAPHVQPLEQNKTNEGSVIS